MFLQKLEIHGFKSFAEKAILEFNHDLTAIVGPNGSGKSNVADAVRWVLGEQSLKLLRGKKSEDVIFSGSGSRTRLGFAEVNLYLNNEDGHAPIDYREVVIARRIYRSGESEYLINKNKVRLLDIQLLLARASFGQRAYSIIGQGMIDSILVSSPAERKEFFDEATGVREHQLKKDQALAKLEQSQLNLSQSRQVLEEIEPRLRTLTRQVKRLEKKEEIARQLFNLQSQYYTQLTVDLTKEQDQLNQQLLKFAERKKELTKTKGEIEETIEQLQNQDTQAQAFKKLQNEYAKVTEEKNQLLQEASLTQSRLDLELTKLGKVDLLWLQNKKTQLNAKAEELKNQLEENHEQSQKLDKQLEEKTANQQQILKEYQALQNQLFGLQQSLTKHDRLSLTKIQAHLQALSQKQQAFLDNLDKLDQLEKLPKLKNQAEEINKEINWLVEKLHGTDKVDSAELLKIQEKLNEFLTTKDSLVNEIQELAIELETTKHLNQQLKKQESDVLEDLKKINLEISQAGSPEITDQSLKSRSQELAGKLQKLEERLQELEQQLADFSKHQEKDRSQLFAQQRHLRELQTSLQNLAGEEQEIKIKLAKTETRFEDLEKEIALETKGQFKTLAEKISLNLGETYEEINRLKNQLAIIGGIDEEVLKEYQEVKARHDFLSEQITDLASAIASCHELIASLEEKIKVQFESAFEKINDRFIHYFKILFNGGNAKLILQKKEIVEEEELPENNQENTEVDAMPTTNKIKKPFGTTQGKKKYEFGIDIVATPPGKKVKSLNMLSGGEKALTSIALIAAIIDNNPSPFVILDEVDAALDEANSERFVKIIDELSDRTQFICITHNRATMHQASILYGVTMGADGVSKLLSINLTEAEKVAE